MSCAAHQLGILQQTAATWFTMWLFTAACLRADLPLQLTGSSCQAGIRALELHLGKLNFTTIQSKASTALVHVHAHS